MCPNPHFVINSTTSIFVSSKYIKVTETAFLWMDKLIVIHKVSCGPNLSLGDLLQIGDAVTWLWICSDSNFCPPSRATVLHLRLPNDQRCSTAPWAAGMVQEVNWRKTQGQFRNHVRYIGCTHFLSDSTTWAPHKLQGAHKRLCSWQKTITPKLLILARELRWVNQLTWLIMKWTHRWS